MRRFSALLLAVPVVVLVHCSGSGSTDVGSGDAATAGDGSTDGAATGDATTGDDGASDGSTSGDDGSTQADTATGDDSGDGSAACGSSATRAACITCCTSAHPQGANTLASDELACACTPEDCGPLDGGETSDAGDLGTGACTAECAAPSQHPGATCDVCLRRSVGSEMTHGPCYTQVTAACESDTACKAYATCELTCPAN